MNLFEILRERGKEVRPSTTAIDKKSPFYKFMDQPMSRRDFNRRALGVLGSLIPLTRIKKAAAERINPKELETLIEESVKEFTDFLNQYSDVLEGADQDKLSPEEAQEYIVGVLNFIIDSVYDFNSNQNVPEGVTYALFQKLTNSSSEEGYNLNHIITLLQERFIQYGFYFNVGRPFHDGSLFCECEVERINPHDYRGLTETFDEETIEAVSNLGQRNEETLKKFHKNIYGVEQPGNKDGLKIIHINDPKSRINALTIGQVIVLNHCELKSVYQDKYSVIASKNKYLKALNFEDFIKTVKANELNHLCVDFEVSNATEEWSGFNTQVPGYQIEGARQIREFLSDVSSLNQDQRFAWLVFNNLFLNLDVYHDKTRCDLDESYSFTNNFMLTLLEKIFQKKEKGRVLQKTVEECKNLIRKNQGEKEKLDKSLQRKEKEIKELKLSFSEKLFEEKKKIVKEMNRYSPDDPQYQERNKEGVEKLMKMKKDHIKERQFMASELNSLNNQRRKLLDEMGHEVRQKVAQVVKHLNEKDFEYIKERYNYMAFHRPEDEGGSIWEHLKKNSGNNSREADATNS
ncbi:MAG: hypothetical protein GF347_03375 [Candidatus Moranbacteria bacterium]|nr:hypothetical protein [Candidatus Moranbacteria bacterium]